MVTRLFGVFYPRFVDQVQEQITNSVQTEPPLDGGAPRVWVVTGYRAGERSQLLALAERLDWPYELKELSYRKTEFTTSLFRGNDLRGIRLKHSSALAPPWPDLVLSAGMRNEPVGRWIRNRSGGKTRLVHVGRPWADPERFDLVITTPQYPVPRRPNVLCNTMTLSLVSPRWLEEKAVLWRQRYAALPGPYTGALLGGDSGPYTFGRKTAQRLAREANRLVQSTGGSLLITTSARTSPEVVDVLEQEIDVPFDLYKWKKGDDSNPYSGILALSDRLIVSADSISMLSEACTTCKPVYMLDPVSHRYPMRNPAGARFGEDRRLQGFLYSLLLRVGPRRLGRDIRLVHRKLLAEHRAVWLGEDFPDEVPAPADDVQRALARVRQLFNRQ